MPYLFAALLGRQPESKTIMAVRSVFARLPRYHPSAPGTGRQRIEVKSAQTGTN